MNSEQKKLITGNLVFLTENTRDIGRFAVHLVAEGLLSQSDKQIMESKTVDSDKLYYMYGEVMKTGKYAELVQILDATDNKEIADILRPLLPSHQSGENSTKKSNSSGPGINDFVVSRDGVTKIVDILAEFPLGPVWVDNIARRLLRENTFANLDRAGIYSVILMRTLDAWRNDKDEAATLQSLVEIIEPHNHSAAMKLLNQSEKIKNAKT